MRVRWFIVLLFFALIGCAREHLATALRDGNFARAYPLIRARAEQGEVAAQTALGTLYYVGAGVPRDFAQALHWYERAALAGDLHAQRNLGSMFQHGAGTPKDDFRAFGWYDSSFRQGNLHAREYMTWMALVVGWNQQALARRWIARDLQAQQVSHGRAKQKGG